MKPILVTGATGFIGSRLVDNLIQGGSVVRRLVRKPAVIYDKKIEDFVFGNLTPESNLTFALKGVGQVIHLAALVHNVDDPVADHEYTRYNFEATLHLGRCAAAAGVKRLIFISSVKVNGEESSPGTPFIEDDSPVPQDAYAVSKWKAEEGLMKLAGEAGIEVVVIRPPLVYGPGVKANFFSIMRLVAHGFPLPLGAIHNMRSLVALDNLVDLIVTCMNHSAAANHTFLAGDGEDLSTTDLVKRLGCALGKPVRLLPVPAWLLKAGASMLGKRDIAQRLCGSLQVDISKARTVLGWNPPVSVDDALRATADYFLENT